MSSDTDQATTPSPWRTLSPTARRVALEVLLHGPLARTELAQRLELSTPSLTRLSKPLLDMGLLRESEDTAARNGGRPLQPLDLDPDVQHFVGVKLTGSHAHGVLTDLRAGIKTAMDLPLHEHAPDRVVDALTALVTRLTAGRAGPAAIGVGLGGVVRDNAHVLRAPFLNWGAVDLADLIEQQIGIPAVISNDLDALTEAERWFGAGRDVDDFAVVTIGAGVGLGVVVHDALVTGPDSGLGLLGHFPLDPLGPACPEGHRGCSNALLTTDAIRVHASLALGRALTYDEVLDLAADGDPAADQIIGNSAHALGALVAAVANIVQPRRIILTGEGIRLAVVGRERLDAGIASNRLPEASPLDVSVLEDDPTIWARGAAAVAIQETVLARGRQAS
ncbi:ROK family transcriptional regulator [Cellulomonas sp. APG4]|uniref:ROK family protein n=1 Tax=Cellulomonas sp. APG4 TaxID=1538656 RepID=UPI00137A12EF|nr:ROK family transcriptional regulator [Cellulomonas sp. APG4]